MDAIIKSDRIPPYDKDIRGDVMEKVIDFIRTDYRPEDVFQERDLIDWARRHSWERK